MSEVKSLFEPDSAVLVGSSKIHEKIGMTSPWLFESVIHNMTKFFEGKTYVLDVNGKKEYKTLEELPETPDLGVIMLPPELSIQQAEKCAKMGVKALVAITGGYKGRQRQQLTNLKEEYGTRILGPNTIMGVINTAKGLNTTFERDLMPRRGNISVISQSGGVGACLLDWACFYGIGISKFAFMGDKIDVNDVDLLLYLSEDQQTRVICLYMEGIENGREFIEVARKVVKKKPILVLKGGATKEAARRALSHTASIAGSDIIFDAAFRKAGTVRVEDPEELFNAAIALTKQPPLSGDNIAIVSNVGGPAILAADAVVKNGLKLAMLSEKTKKEIEHRYPGVDAVNPVDLIADARTERYSTVLDLVLADPNVDGVMVINMLKSCFFEPEDAAVIAETARKHPKKPVVDVPAGGEDFMLVYEVLRDTSIPVYNLPEKAARALRVLRTYHRIAGS
ncbi:MAG: CoA-binding protein [Candidatus Bathyarchaeota archaeon]|nr:CoA-binding protein [Candidatus Bathyarchaeota archaeon]MDH5712930.1 CoA-binding protein [Candidatus Bathyarchaeota archaeon]